MQLFYNYKTMLKVLSSVTLIALCGLIWTLQPNQPLPVTVMFAVLGFVWIPITAVTFEAAAECTYPVNEEVSRILLLTSAAVFSSFYLFIWGWYLPITGHFYESRWNFSSYLTVSSAFSAWIIMLIFRGKYERLQTLSPKKLEQINQHDSGGITASNDHSSDIAEMDKESKLRLFITLTTPNGTNKLQLSTH